MWDVPDCVGDGRSVPEASVIEPATLEEEPVTESNRLSLTISCSVKAMVEDVEVQA